jgi:hypothetical protein
MKFTSNIIIILINDLHHSLQSAVKIPEMYVKTNSRSFLPHSPRLHSIPIHPSAALTTQQSRSSWCSSVTLPFCPERPS